MVSIRSTNEIILSLIDFFKLAQSDLDTKPGTVARDLFVEGPASALSILYNELSSVSSQQSLRLVIGSDLDKLSKNFGVVRKQSTPSSGIALLTFSSINAPINIDRGARIIASNGFAFSVVSGTAVTPAASNFYRSVASKFRDQLDLAGISDEFAVEVTVQATAAGSSGNIGAYSLNRTTISGVSNVTNINSFAGGTDQESDASFRNRILSSFSGSSVGTALGYLNVALGTTGVADAFVVEPGDPLMTRDGTVVKIATDGTRTIVSEGSGGKVDVVILGNNLVENKDTFIYRDKSNNNDPTSSKNDVVLGQISGDENKTVNRRRIDNIKNGVTPNQPVNDILEVTGSNSGSNFIPKSVDSLGRVSGNYELIKDTGIYGGSLWGFDKFHWTSNKISLFSEDRVKGLFNGQDNVTFTDLTAIPKIQQNISIINENSIVTSDRSIIQLLHSPVSNVTRIFNVHTGERYIITDQNPDKTGVYNTTGRIKISGNTLPSASDPLQVDYSWVVNYDPTSDYDGLENTNNIRSVTDSIDWGYASEVRNENIIFTKDTTGNFFIGTASLPISAVTKAIMFTEINGVASTVTSGVFTNRVQVIISNLENIPQTVDSVTFKNNNAELYKTDQNDGTFIVASTVVGIDLRYNLTIILPSDTVAVSGDRVSVFLDNKDVFNGADTQGSSVGSQITIPSSLIVTTATKIELEVSYIANVSDLYSSAITSLPASNAGNGFVLNNNLGFNNFSPANISRRENQIVQKNTSNQIYVELNLLGTDFTLLQSQIVTVVKLSDGKELWNSSNMGTITLGISGNYQLLLSGYNTPAVADRVLVIYYATDIKRFQPFTYENILIKNKLAILTTDAGTGKLTVALNAFTDQATSLQFNIIEPNTDISIINVTDGYLIDNGDGTAIVDSLTVSFANTPDLLNKQIKIFNANDPLNDGVYDIISYNITNNRITITNVLNKISVDQISIIRILDGKEIWNYDGVINGNKLLLPLTAQAHAGDQVEVMIFNFKTLKAAPTKIIATTVDQTVNTGVITINGSTLFKADDVIFTATNTGLKLNMSEALRKALNLSSVASIPSNIKLVRITKLEKVVTASATNDEVLEILTTYDLTNTTLQNNLLYPTNFLANATLQNLEFILPNTSNNTSATSENLPKIGDKIRITFYYLVDNDFENLSYTRNGPLYTNKKFAFINKMYISSGFSASQSTKFTVTSFTQPGLGTRYKAFYDYIAPKQNERIVIRFNNNKLISDVTFAIENTRPINADVLVRQAKQISLDLTINVVIDDNFKSSSTTVLQNLRDKLISTLTTTTLGSIVDVPTIINVAQAVSGIARARVLFFNKTGNLGTVLKVQAQQDEYFAPNDIIINTETR